ncbi:hypothetical protein C1E24_08615 [Pseudoalteromonas phenolica]|uniref:Uncharacterized protein n=1 Tax=Pseudoalteromonas phenolica TaxID=161398 RepID=A0A5R9Q3K8_9GAMM|nr:hypothetical protein [Pseudoalteromonas phenolica]TLX47404.1 hypothetical protein C1E24_08615 [Pseudoalteromonas phenolica]
MSHQTLSKLVMKWAIATLAIVCAMQMLSTHIQFLYLTEDDSVGLDTLGNNNFSALMTAIVMVFLCIKDVSLKLLKEINEKTEFTANEL